MDYQVFPEEKLLCMWDNRIPDTIIEEYRDKGYRFAYFVRGTKPVQDALRTIVLSRCRKAGVWE